MGRRIGQRRKRWKRLKTGNWKKDGRAQFSATSTSSIQHPILKILHQASAGPGAARNRGLAESTGEFVHFFDSDDIAAPNKHEVQLRALLETGADIAYGPWVNGHFAPVEKLKDFLTTDDTDKHGYQMNQPGNAQGACAGDTFSNPFTSELARDYEITSPSRSASGPAFCALREIKGIGEKKTRGCDWLAKRGDVLGKHPKARLRVIFQNISCIRAAKSTLPLVGFISCQFVCFVV